MLLEIRDKIWSGPKKNLNQNPMKNQNRNVLPKGQILRMGTFFRTVTPCVQIHTILCEFDQAHTPFQLETLGRITIE